MNLCLPNPHIEATPSICTDNLKIMLNHEVQNLVALRKYFIYLTTKKGLLQSSSQPRVSGVNSEYPALCPVPTGAWGVWPPRCLVELEEQAELFLDLLRSQTWFYSVLHANCVSPYL